MDRRQLKSFCAPGRPYNLSPFFCLLFDFCVFWWLECWFDFLLKREMNYSKLYFNNSEKECWSTECEEWFLWSRLWNERVSLPAPSRVWFVFLVTTLPDLSYLPISTDLGTSKNSSRMFYRFYRSDQLISQTSPPIILALGFGQAQLWSPIEW